jgi:AraC-like DNA-binding protein
MRELGVSSGHLAAIFKRHFGLAPIQYLGQVRIKHAKDLLLQTDDPIAFVAYDVGFDSLAAFYRFFKKHTGTTPAEYRKAAAAAASAAVVGEDVRLHNDPHDNLYNNSYNNSYANTFASGSTDKRGST